MNTFRNFLISSIVCVFCGVAVGFIVVPLYIAADVIRMWGMAKLEVNTLTADDVYGLSSFLIGHGLIIMALLLVLVRKHSWRTALLVAFTNPLAFCFPFIMALTDTNEHWYQAILNAFTHLSLPVLQCLLAMAALKTLTHRKKWGDVRREETASLTAR
jgi:hypothetical protein